MHFRSYKNYVETNNVSYNRQTTPSILVKWENVLYFNVAFHVLHNVVVSQMALHNKEFAENMYL